MVLEDPVLGDYKRNVPDARDAEVLSLFTAIVKKLQAKLSNEVPLIFDAVFECTLDMITKNFEDHLVLGSSPPGKLGRQGNGRDEQAAILCPAPAPSSGIRSAPRPGGGAAVPLHTSCSVGVLMLWSPPWKLVSTDGMRIWEESGGPAAKDSALRQRPEAF